MKQFIYLDTDIINSIIAQTQQGLISELGNEQTKADTKGTSKEGTVELNATAGGSFFKLAKAEANLSGGGKLQNESQIQSSTKEIVSKILHDASFNMAYEEIKDNIKLASNDVEDVGDYVEINHVFNFVDLEYLQELFSEGGFISYLKKSTANNLEAQIQVPKLPKEQQRAAESAMRKELQKKVAESNKQYDEILNIVKAIRNIIPYNRMLVSNTGFLFPLEDRYFRVTPSTLGFKYGGQITALGLVTNVIGPDTKPVDDSNVFATLQYSVNEALRSILPPSKEEHLYIVHPIAIFYGK